MFFETLIILFMHFRGSQSIYLFQEGKDTLLNIQIAVIRLTISINYTGEKI